MARMPSFTAGTAGGMAYAVGERVYCIVASSSQLLCHALLR